MKYLLDTHTFLWSIFESHKLSKTARQILLDPSCRKYICASSMWEISIKNRINRKSKLPLPNGVAGVFDEINANGYGYVGINRQCIEVYNKLPLIHGDPFDGILIAAALVGDMTLVTADEEIQKYDVKWTW